MEVKGTGLITTRDYVKENFGDQYEAWLNSLPENTRNWYENLIDSRQWYPLKEAYCDALNHIVDMFYEGDIELGGNLVGAWSAEKTLKGVYKAFLFVASPGFLLQRAAKIISTFYEPCDISIFERDKKGITMHINQFNELDKTLEYRIGGWSKRAFELAGCSNVSYIINKSLTNNDRITEYIFKWD